nr:MAG TPA: Putative endo-beta-N-acetylglucosaminidase surface protein [Caudoviricetes sp.]
MLDKKWDTIRPLTFDGSITEYEFLCKILNQIETVQKELQEEIDNIVAGGGGITDEERQKIDSLTNTGIQLMNSLTEGDVSRLKVLTDNGANWANQINGYQGTDDDAVARAQWVLETAQVFYSRIASQLLPEVTPTDNGKVAKVVNGNWAIGIVEGGGDSKWTDAAVEYFATVLEHLVYDDASTGQTAATYLLNILRGGAPFITEITAEWSYGQVIYPNTALTNDMFTVRAAYSDGSVVPVTEFSFSPQVASANPTEVTITYEGKTAVVSVPVGTVSLTGITAEYIGTGTIYVGDNLTKNMFNVTANYNDGSSNVVSDYTFTPVTMLNAGEQVVTFTYQGKETTATVTVVALSVTRITASWIGGTIFKGNAFTKSMFSVTAKYNNGTSKAVSDYTFTPATANSTPTTLVLIEYQGKSTSVSVNVIDAAASNLVVNSYTLNSGVARIYPGDKFLEKGKFNVTVNYSDGSSSTITDNSGLAVRPESADSAGDKIITVSLVASPTVSGTVGITVSEAPKVNTIRAVYNGANNPKAGDVLTIANFTVIHTDQYQNIIHSGWAKDYLSNDTAAEIESITVVEGEQTVYVRCLTKDARTLATSTVVTGEKAGATSSSGTAQGTGSKTFANITQDNAVTNPTSITFTSQDETQPSGGANLCYKVILTKEGDNWTMAFYRFTAKNTPYPGEIAKPYATVTIADGIVTKVTLPKFQFSETLAVNSNTANGYQYTMEVH